MTRATSVIWRTVVYAGAMLATNPGCPSGGTRTVCHPASAEEMPRSPQWDLRPAETPSESSAEGFTVMVESEPPGAQIFVGDELVGVAPVQFQVAIDTVNVRAELEGYASAPTRITPTQDLDARVTMVTEEEANRPAEVCEHVGRGFVLS
jgi:hypothetical protein